MSTSRHNEEVVEKITGARKHVQQLLDECLPSRQRKRQRSGAAAASPSLVASSPASPSTPTAPTRLADVVTPVLRWCKQSQLELDAVARELPRGTELATLYAHSPEDGDNAANYVVLVRIRDQDGSGLGVTFPLIVIPTVIAHSPCRQDILDQPLAKYRPERFGSSTLLVKHAFLVLVCDLFVRPFGLSPGSLSIDPETKVGTYDIVVPDSYDKHVVEVFVETFLYSPRLCAFSDDARTSCVKELQKRDLVCPVTLVSHNKLREGAHVIDQNLGESMFHVLSQALHDEATRSGRYGDLLQPWQGHQWTSDDINRPINQVLVMAMLNQPIDDWAFLTVLEHPHKDEVMCNDILHYYDQWIEPIEQRILPSYIFLSFDPTRPLVTDGHYNLQRNIKPGTGLSTVWLRPPSDSPASELCASNAGTPLPRPPHWFPARADFPPPFLMNNTVASRIIKRHRSYVVDGFASRIPEHSNCGFIVASELRRGSSRASGGSAQSSSDHGAPPVSSSPRPGNDHGLGTGGPGPSADDETDGGGAADEEGQDPSPAKKTKRDGDPQLSDTAALVAFALLSLAATYAVVDDDDEDLASDSDSISEADSCEYLDREEHQEIDSHARVTTSQSFNSYPGIEGFGGMPASTDDFDGLHDDAERAFLLAPARSLPQGETLGRKRGADDSSGADKKRSRDR